MKLMSAVVLVGVMLSVGCAQQSKAQTGQPALQSSATDPKVPEQWKTIVKFNYPASPPAPQPTVSFQLAIADPERNPANVAQTDAAKVRTITLPYFIFVTGQHGRVEVENINVYAEGTSFGIYADEPTLTVFKFLHDQPGGSHAVVVTGSDGSTVNLSNTSMIEVPRNTATPELKQANVTTFNESVENNARVYSGLPAAYLQRIQVISTNRDPQH